MAAWLLSVLMAAAGPCPSHALRLDWVRDDNAQSCPSGERVADRISERLGCTPFGPRPDARFEVWVTASGEGWWARVTRYDAANERVSQRILESEAADCAVLSEAVALTLAFVAERLPRVDTASVSTAAFAPEPLLRVETATVSAAPPPAITSTAAGLRIVLVPTSTSVRPQPRAPTARGRIEIGTVLNAGTMPGPSFGARLGARLELSEHVDLAVGMTILPTRTWDRFAFGLVAGWLGPCVRFQPHAILELGGCARFYGGAITAVVLPGAAPIEPGVFPWLAASVGGTAVLDLGRSLYLAAEVEALATLVDRVFLTWPDMNAVFDERAVALMATVGLGVRFR